jgi:DNA invertase Pin-like site-specific DNA recombinase
VNSEKTQTPPGNARRAALYLRISTDKQETEAQRQACAAYALAEHLPIVQTITDTVSGSLPWRKRALGPLLADATGLTDIIVYEYSRIGRDMVDTLEFLKTCNERGLSVHVAKNRTVIRADLGGKVLSTVMSLAAEIERDLLRSRTRDALTDRQRRIDTEGGFTSKAGVYRTKLGRPPGSTGAGKLDPYSADLGKLFDAQVSDSAIARIYECDRRTVAAARARYKPALAGTGGDDDTTR